MENWGHIKLNFIIIVKHFYKTNKVFNLVWHDDFILNAIDK